MLEMKEEWNIGDKFTSPETGESVFIVIKASKDYVEACDKRSRSGITSFAKWFIKKVPEMKI